MARLTPHALAQTTRPLLAVDDPRHFRGQTPDSVDMDRMRRRVQRIRREERWADERITNNVRSLMHGRYGVRL